MTRRRREREASEAKKPRKQPPKDEIDREIDSYLPLCRSVNDRRQLEKFRKQFRDPEEAGIARLFIKDWFRRAPKGYKLVQHTCDTLKRPFFGANEVHQLVFGVFLCLIGWIFGLQSWRGFSLVVFGWLFWQYFVYCGAKHTRRLINELHGSH